MKTPFLPARRKKGQILVMVAIILVAMVFMAGLLVDGGYTMVLRRHAQAAADAGALAGARTLCSCTSATVTQKAIEYAISNGAENATANISQKQVSVSVSISHAPFFSQILGSRALTSDATAKAGCYAPTQANRSSSTSSPAPLTALPLGWYKATADTTCKIAGVATLDWYTQVKGQTTFPAGTLNIFIDGGDGSGHSSPVDYNETKCGTASGYMKCSNIAGVGKVWGGLERWWIDSAPSTITTSGTYSGLPGANNAVSNDNSMYSYLQSHKNNLYLLPVMDSTGKHVVGFSAFYVTCVETDYPNSVPSHGTWNNNNACPGGNAWLAANKANANNYHSRDSGRTIEGYFVRDYPVDINLSPSYFKGTTNIDLGLHFISLIP